MTESRGPREIYSISNVAPEGSSREFVINPAFSLKIKDFSTLKHLRRITTWALRFVHNLRKGKISGPLTTLELNEARRLWEKYVQSYSFPTTINNIKLRKQDELKKQLGIELDDKGLLRCHGRLTEMTAIRDTKFPKLLPKNDPFTD